VNTLRSHASWLIQLAHSFAVSNVRRSNFDCSLLEFKRILADSFTDLKNNAVMVDCQV